MTLPPSAVPEPTLISGSGTCITFTCYGLPVPQGSTRAFVVNGRAVTTSANRSLRPWRDSLASAARFAMQESHTPALTGPVLVSAEFILPRPKSRPKRDLWPDRRPDLDKLVRGLLDGLTGPVFVDDAQVVQVLATKSYPADGTLAEPGVRIVVRAL